MRTLGFIILFFIAVTGFSNEADSLLKKPPEWFKTAAAREIGRHILSWQTPNGDWPKNTDTVTVSRPTNSAAIKGTFDNSATLGELRLLAKLYVANRDEAFRDAFLKGLKLILKAQYPNGGWPQSYPPGNGYARHITYNDNTFVRLADFTRDVATDVGFDFVPKVIRTEAQEAYGRAVQCVLRTQIKVDGELTVWCAQHDEVTLEPRPARTFELVSLSGAESAQLILFLMRVDQPAPDVRAAVKAGVKWFERVKLTGLRQVRENGDKKIVNDPNAPPLWTRFYEIGTNRPIFSGRDSVKRYSIAEIEAERRNGYAWYGEWGSSLSQPYAEWCKRWNVE